MQVRATAVGYAGKDGHALRQPGDVFEIEDGAKGSWFTPVKKEGRGRTAAQDDSQSQDETLV